ncbi:MAG TPA: GNAT family N-acetyltransferase, partial [Candidatus Polarisedimenticolia bacterium]|nr:GNAT family N-acetyltransferase [Candidatus Polarisedimenticolia bacterium]
VRTITSYHEFVELEPIWGSLTDEAKIDHPFLSHEVVRTAWECFGRDNTLRIMLVRDDAGPLAIAPLMLGRERIMGLRLRRLGFIYNVALERLDFIVARRHAQAYAALWEQIRSIRSSWDVLILPQLPADSRTLFELPRRAAADGFLTGFWRSSDAAFVAAKGGWEAFLQGLDSRHRHNIRRRLRRLCREHEVHLDQLSPGDDLDAALREGLRLEAAAWKGAAGTAIASRPDALAFYTTLARRCARRGWLRLRFLRVDGRRVAFSFALCYRNNVYSLKGGYDPEHAMHSPFTLLSFMVLKDALERGAARYEFLGPADPWKLAWTRRSRPHCWFFAFAPALRTRCIHRLKFRWLPGLRKARATAPLRRLLLGWISARRKAGR